MLSKGLAYEKLALEYLQRFNLILLEQNYRSRFGEIDLIMKDGNILSFIEVRYRNKPSHGSASESVNLLKQQKIIKSATAYLNQKNCWHLESRFDVIAISPRKKLPFKNEIQWYKAAFMC